MDGHLRFALTKSRQVSLIMADSAGTGALARFFSMQNDIGMAGTTRALAAVVCSVSVP